jgi:glutathione S-transferase
MIKLCGFSVSNYHNKVKLALIEKNVLFEEVLIWSDRSADLLRHSPLGKIPYIETEQGSICESQVILEYLEEKYPAHRLLPIDPFQAAKNRELITYLELHLELVARELYAEAFFGGRVSDEVKAKVEKLLTRNLKAFAELAQFSPYVMGEEFTMADCAAAVHFPLISMATKAIFARDFLEDLPVKQYLKMMSQRPSVQKVNVDRKANQELMMSRIKAS